MTLNDLIATLSENDLMVWVFTALPLLALACRLLHGKHGGSQSPWKYLYAVLVYCCAVPGMFSAMLCFYSMLFLQESLLDKSIVVYFAPFFSMLITLGLISKFVSLDDVPGFDRISGLMTMLGVTFFLLLVLNRFNVWVVFGGGIGSMFAIGAFLFLLLRWGAKKAFRSPSQR